MWLKGGRCKDVVRKVGKEGKRVSRWPLEACLEECQSSLKTWNKHTFSHVGKQIADLQNKLQALESMKGNATDLESIHASKMELNSWLGIEEMWHHRSRKNWLKAGDKNTTFFHTKASN